MSILGWNSRELGNPQTVKKKDPICVFLMENKLTIE